MSDLQTRFVQDKLMEHDFESTFTTEVRRVRNHFAVASLIKDEQDSLCKFGF